MKLTKVEAGSLQEALRKIRATLGEEANIVGTRSFRRGGVLGVGGKEVVEVYVADPRPRPGPGDAEAHRRAASPASTAVRGACAEGAEDLQALSKALDQIRDEIRTLVRDKADLPEHPFLRDAYALLLDRDVEPKLAARIAGQLEKLPLPMGIPDQDRVRAVVAAQLRKLFLPNVPLPGNGGPPRTVVLVGPTGVGKTTTIAKLAARARIAEGRNVGLVTLDTFRIGAVDQLHKYAQIIGIPLAVASDPVEFQAALRTFAREGVETVFVDSAGRSQRDELKMAELREFLRIHPGAEVHLVLSTTTQPRTIRNVAERFSAVNFHRVILTKLDETFCFGTLLGVLVEIGKPISFIADGQNVPDDIMASDPERLAELVLRKQNG